MPTGLDGHPDPIVTADRTAVLDAIADRVDAVDHDRVLVGIDGRSGSGKSTFADELARSLRRRGRAVVRSTTDLFHRPRSERFRLGTTSPEGYYRDSHQLDTIVEDLLAPFRSGAEEVLVGAFDEPHDRPAPVTEVVADRAVLVFDGLFLHRPELADRWDLSVLLLADGRADAAWLRHLEDGLPAEPSERAAELDRRLERARWPRYRQGWTRYLAEADLSSAVRVDNGDLAVPRLVPG